MKTTEAWIDGKTLRLLGQRIGVDVDARFGMLGSDSKISLNPEEHNYLLGIEQVHGAVFVIDGNMFATIHDHPSSHEAPAEIVESCGFRFTRRALQSLLSELSENSSDGGS